MSNWRASTWESSPPFDGISLLPHLAPSGLSSVLGTTPLNSAGSAGQGGLSTILFGGRTGSGGFDAASFSAKLRAVPEVTYGYDDQGRAVDIKPRSPKMVKKARGGAARLATPARTSAAHSALAGCGRPES